MVTADLFAAASGWSGFVAVGNCDGRGGATIWTLPRAISAVVGNGIAALGLKGELVAVRGCVSGGSGAPATGISVEVVGGTITWGMVTWGMVTVPE